MTIKRKSSFSLETPCFLTRHFLLSSLSPYPKPPMANHTFPVPEDLSDAETVTKNTISSLHRAWLQFNGDSRGCITANGLFRLCGECRTRGQTDTWSGQTSLFLTCLPGRYPWRAGGRKEDRMPWNKSMTFAWKESNGSCSWLHTSVTCRTHDTAGQHQEVQGALSL